MAHDALGAHARDELGISATKHPRPVQAALASATSFSVGAGVPLAVAALVPAHELLVWIAVSAIVFLGLLGALGAYVGGAKWVPGALRTTFWGALAMLTTAGAGALFGAVA
jgi:VIT1/CCC1 family predicted Fe2+/Mn2+ transporter